MYATTFSESTKSEKSIERCLLARCDSYPSLPQTIDVHNGVHTATKLGHQLNYTPNVAPEKQPEKLIRPSSFIVQPTPARIHLIYYLCVHCHLDRRLHI